LIASNYTFYRREDPYRLDPPSLISFSGGRTSGYMLEHILVRHEGILPDGCHVVFFNTGKERPETLDFVFECGERWGVPIRWLEYNPDAPGKFQETSYETASRNGEPFEALVKSRKWLPNPVARICTVEMKVLTGKRFMQANGYDDWENLVGIRADEPRRVTRLSNSDAGSPWRNTMPLAWAGVTKPDVLAWWAKQPFDLGLPDGMGNCTLCFLMSRANLDRRMRAWPEEANWWARMEQEVGGTFRSDRPSYRVMLKVIQEQPELGWDNEEYEGIPCNCTD
jgi:3'-phosphoadenosine 5'-phosphosulfate sulfotransferase (PAPS reductase)/FAD synthetase